MFQGAIIIYGSRGGNKYREIRSDFFHPPLSDETLFLITPPPPPHQHLPPPLKIGLLFSLTPPPPHQTYPLLNHVIYMQNHFKPFDLWVILAHILISYYLRWITIFINMERSWKCNWCFVMFYKLLTWLIAPTFWTIYLIMVTCFTHCWHFFTFVSTPHQKVFEICSHLICTPIP